MNEFTKELVTMLLAMGIGAVVGLSLVALFVLYLGGR